MDIYIILTVFSGISVATCLFIVTYFLFIRNENKLQDISLGLLFLAIALRIAKSVFYYIFPDLAPIGVAIGFLGFASIGPLLLFYYRFSNNSSAHFNKLNLLHFVIPLIGFFVISILQNYANNFYLLAKFSFASYLLYIGYMYFYVLYTPMTSKWHKTLFFMMWCLLASFTFQFFVGTLQSYAIGTALASIIVYGLFFVILKTPILIKRVSSEKLQKELLDKVIKAIERDKVYRQPSITLTKFAEIIDSPVYLVSKATKSIYKKSFPEVINFYRIKEITAMLMTPKDLDDTIEELAFDVGFNTPSAFYNAFKKETSMTPRSYQKMACEKSLQSN